MAYFMCLLLLIRSNKSGNKRHKLALYYIPRYSKPANQNKT